MTTYTITAENEIEIDFHDLKPSTVIRSKMKAVKIWWNPDRMLQHGFNNADTLAVAKEIFGEGQAAPVVNVQVSAPVSQTAKKCVRKTPATDYALKVKIKDIVNADKAQFETWGKMPKDYVNTVMSEDKYA